MKNGFYIVWVFLGLCASITASVADVANEQDASDQQAQAVNQLNTLLKNTRMIPHFENGRPTGYDIVPADDSAPAPADVQRLQIQAQQGDQQTAPAGEPAEEDRAPAQE